MDKTIFQKVDSDLQALIQQWNDINRRDLREKYVIELTPNKTEDQVDNAISHLEKKKYDTLKAENVSLSEKIGFYQNKDEESAQSIQEFRQRVERLEQGIREKDRVISILENSIDKNGFQAKVWGKKESFFVHTISKLRKRERERREKEKTEKKKLISIFQGHTRETGRQHNLVEADLSDKIKHLTRLLSDRTRSNGLMRSQIESQQAEILKIQTLATHSNERHRQEIVRFQDEISTQKDANFSMNVSFEKEKASFILAQEKEKTKLTEENNQLNLINLDCLAKIKELEEVVKAQSHFRITREEFEAIEKENESLKVQVATSESVLLTGNSEKEIEIFRLTKKLDEFSRENSALKEESNRKDSDVTELGAQLQTLQQQLKETQLTAEYNKTRFEVNQAQWQERDKGHETLVLALEQQIRHLHVEVEAKTKSVDECLESAAESTRLCDKAEKELQTKKVEFKDLQTRMQELESLNSEKKDQLDGSKRELQSFQEKITDLNDQIVRMQGELQTAQQAAIEQTEMNSREEREYMDSLKELQSKYDEENSRSQDQLSQLKMKIQVSEEKLALKNVEIGRLETKYQKQVATNSNEAQSYFSTVNELKTKISTLTNQLLQRQQADEERDAEIDDLRSQLQTSDQGAVAKTEELEQTFTQHVDSLRQEFQSHLNETAVKLEQSETQLRRVIDELNKSQADLQETQDALGRSNERLQNMGFNVESLSQKIQDQAAAISSVEERKHLYFVPREIIKHMSRDELIKKFQIVQEQNLVLHAGRALLRDQIGKPSATKSG